MCEKGKELAYKDEVWKIGENFSCDPKKIIRGLTSDWYITFEGKTRDGRPIAVKRYQLVDINTKNLGKFYDDYIQRNLDHPNVLRYMQYAKNEYFLYLVTEPCAGTLEDYVKGVYNGPFIGSKRDILLQMAEGLCFLHKNGIIHGDIKPANIFISATKKPQIKLGDFCIRTTLIWDQEPKDLFVPMKQVNSKTNSLNSNDGNSFKGDIFSMGCVFFYTLSDGVHPYGEMKRKDFKGSFRDDENELILKMCNMNPAQRSTAQEVKEFILTKTIPSYGIQRNNESQQEGASVSNKEVILDDSGIASECDDPMNSSTDSVNVKVEGIESSKSNKKLFDRTCKTIKILSNSPIRKSPRISKNLLKTRSNSK